MFIVLYAGSPMKFHTNLIGKMFTAVANDHEATVFTNEDDARRTAKEHGLPERHMTIQPLNP